MAAKKKNSKLPSRKQQGKLRRELSVAAGKKIPASKLVTCDVVRGFCVHQTPLI
jgi:hypothetical protein